MDQATAGEVPGGFAISSAQAYQMTTSAELSGSITIAFVVRGPISLEDFNNLSVLQNENGVLVDVTASTPVRDYSTLTIYADTNSLGSFYVVRKGEHVKPLFDQTKTYKSGSKILIKIQLLNGSNTNISSANTAVTARNLELIGGTANVLDFANAEHNFRYDSTLGGLGGGYVYNLSTNGLTSGQYVLGFYVGSDRTFFYQVKFEVK